MTHPSDTPTVAPGGGGIDALIEAMYEAGREYASARELAAHDLASHHDKRNRDESEDDFREARDRLRAALLASQRDGARLDWLEETAGHNALYSPLDRTVRVTFDVRDGLRAVIDAAMSASRPSSPPAAPEPENTR